MIKFEDNMVSAADYLLNYLQPSACQVVEIHYKSSDKVEYGIRRHGDKLPSIIIRGDLANAVGVLAALIIAEDKIALANPERIS